MAGFLLSRGNTLQRIEKNPPQAGFLRYALQALFSFFLIQQEVTLLQLL